MLENDEEVPRVHIEFTVNYSTIASASDTRASAADKKGVTDARAKDRSPANARKDSAKGDANNVTQKVGQNLKERTS